MIEADAASLFLIAVAGSQSSDINNEIQFVALCGGVAATDKARC